MFDCNAHFCKVFFHYCKLKYFREKNSFPSKQNMMAIKDQVKIIWKGILSYIPRWKYLKLNITILIYALKLFKIKTILRKSLNILPTLSPWNISMVLEMGSKEKQRSVFPLWLQLKDALQLESQKVRKLSAIKRN